MGAAHWSRANVRAYANLAAARATVYFFTHRWVAWALVSAWAAAAMLGFCTMPQEGMNARRHEGARAP